jgi:lysozyme family protein
MSDASQGTSVASDAVINTAVFDYAFKVVVGEEGNYSNNPNDPGGETKYGIAKAFHPDVDIANLTLPQAKAIYQSEYWLSKWNNLPSLIQIILFDAAVNQGLKKSTEMLQAVIATDMDGDFGSVTLQKTLDFITSWGITYLTTLYLTKRAEAYESDNEPSMQTGFKNRLFNLAICAAQYQVSQ